MNRTLELVKTVYEAGQFGEDLAGPQIALAGRSNVGKSSLINRLAGRKALAKISATPGKTRSINFFRAEPGGFFLVDLPGYGYARASKAEREKWGKLIDGYLKRFRPTAVAALLDCRLPPQQLDLELAAYVQSLGLAVLPVLTKADKASARERAARQAEWRDILHAQDTPLLFSSRTGMGSDKLWARLAAIAEGAASS